MKTETGFEPKKSFVLSSKMLDAPSQPLEIYHLAHDLRSPLNSILGFSQLLLVGIEGPLNENQKVDIGAIYQSARNLQRLIEVVVDLSKLEADLLRFEFESVDLAEVIQNVMGFDFGSTKPEQVELVSQVGDTLPPLWGDRNRIEQMVLNLVRFGFKMRQGGQVTISAESNGQEVTLQVALNEVILTTNQVTELFDLTVHTDDTGRSELGAGGLELPLTQRLVEKHQGQVWVESDENSGTRFYLKLPVAA